MVIGTAAGWSNSWTIVASVILAFLFGYALTLRPLIAGGIALGKAMSLAFAADTISIAIMEIVDNGIMLIRRGRGHAVVHNHH